MNKKIVLFNGCPGSGKDTAAEFAHCYFKDSQIMLFKEKLFELTASIFNVPIGQLTGRMYTRQAKEVPHFELGGLSPREALIMVSEDIIKPTMGDGYFGDTLAKRAHKSACEYVFVSDSGFVGETMSLLNFFCPENIMVVQLFRDGCNFKGDSRGYLFDIDGNSEIAEFGIGHVNVLNDGSLEDLKNDVIREIGEFFSNEGI